MFKKNRDNKIKMIIELLSQALTIKVVDELKWFLGLHVICNRTKRTIWLLQNAYIMKIYSEFIYTNPLQFPIIPIKILELLLIDKDEIVSDSSKILYQ